MRKNAIPIFDAYVRVPQLMGADRGLIILGASMAGVYILLIQTWGSVGVGISIWLLAVWGLRRMAKADTRMREVVLKYLGYNAYYPARATPFAVEPVVVDRAGVLISAAGAGAYLLFDRSLTGAVIGACVFLLSMAILMRIARSGVKLRDAIKAAQVKIRPGRRPAARDDVQGVVVGPVNNGLAAAGVDHQLVDATGGGHS